MGATNCEKLKLLVWKNFLQQWRHMFQSLGEIFLPAVTASLILLMRHAVVPVRHPPIEWPPISAYSLTFSNLTLATLDFDNLTLVYSPENAALELLLQKAIARLAEKNAHLAVPLGRIKFHGYKTDLVHVFQEADSARHVLAAVQFDDDLNGTTYIPSRLSYWLRFPAVPRHNLFYRLGGNSWNTAITLPATQLPGPRYPMAPDGGNDPGYVSEMFIALQHAITMEILSQALGPNFSPPDVYIRRLPHPGYVDDPLITVLKFMFPVMVVLSYMYTAVSTTRFVSREKELHLKESMKIMGIPDELHWLAWFLKQFLFLLITNTIMVFILKLKMKSIFYDDVGDEKYAVFNYTPGSVLFFFFTIYVSATILFSFALSGLFSKASTAALFTSVFWFLSYLPGLFLSAMGVPVWAKLAACLSLNGALQMAFQQITMYEGTGRGMSWEDFFNPLSEEDDFLFGYAVLMLMFDCVFYLLLALYIEKVFPGKIGVRLPWYYPCVPRYWLPKGEIKRHELESNETLVSDNEPGHLHKALVLRHLSKMFPKGVAVKDLSMNVYNGQITVLLGHNGAGKTTTISMVTGIMKPTSGTVMVGGLDMACNTNEARNFLGICPQHNVIFKDLTVWEHLEFFSRLKGFKDEKMMKDVETIIRKLQLEDKTHTLAGKLSGGQQRRLCVGVALCGSPKVVLLDEPTSGMDPSSRRALWDLLQEEKKKRAILLTTHFMDEADILGDRIAIMARGSLRCIGSPFFLKQHYGTGYKLVVVKQFNTKIRDLTLLLQKHIPVELISDRSTELFYSVPTEYLPRFKAMLEELEHNKKKLRIQSYGLIPTSIEDVFMEVGADVDIDCQKMCGKSNSEETVSTTVGVDSISELTEHSTEMAPLENLVTGKLLIVNHVKAMLLKRSMVTLRDWKRSLLQIMIPMFLIFASLMVVNLTSKTASYWPARHFSLREGYVNTVTLLSVNGTVSNENFRAYRAYIRMLEGVSVTSTDLGKESISDYYLRKGSDAVEMSRMRSHYVVGGTFGPGDEVTAWFSNFGYHDVAVALSNVHNAILRASIDAALVDVYNYPLPVTLQRETDLTTLNSILAMQVSNSMGTALSIINSFFVIFYIKERMSRAMLLQKAAGIRPVVMWGSVYVFDVLWYTLINCGIILIFGLYRMDGLSAPDDLARSFLVLTLYSMAALPMQYLISLIFNGPSSGFVLSYFIHTFLGTVGSTIVDALVQVSLTPQLLNSILNGILQFFPTYSLVNAFREMAKLGLINTTCKDFCVVFGFSPHCKVSDICEAGIQSCCFGEKPHFNWNSPGMGRHLVMLFISCVLLWAVLMMIEYDVFRKLRIPKKCHPPDIDPAGEDSDVASEEAAALAVTDAELENYALVCRRLTKCFMNGFLAVNQISFTVKSGECFGLLGVNGAGKTTTFKMLTGDLRVSEGDAFVSGHSIRKKMTRVYKNIGYCPQFDALFEDLTGREILRIYALLRGMHPKDIHKKTVGLARQLNFYSHIDKKVDHYSGGNRRKLSAAISLIGFAPLIYLDEPTTGVDAASKRQMWRAIRNTTDTGRSVVLTSHSMEECEALCSRLAIMVNGRFRCLGSPQRLKNKFSEGFYTLTATLLKQPGLNSNEMIATLHRHIKTSFHGAKRIELHMSMVKYYVPDAVPWSKLFGVMEQVRGSLVEDYLVSQTTLEQVFLQFTKYQVDVPVD